MCVVPTAGRTKTRGVDPPLSPRHTDIQEICCPLSVTLVGAAASVPLEEVFSVTPAKLVTPRWRSEGRLGRNLVRHVEFFSICIIRLISNLNTFREDLGPHPIDARCHPRPRSLAGTCMRLQISVTKKEQKKINNSEWSKKHSVSSWKRFLTLLESVTLSLKDLYIYLYTE